MKSLKFYFRLCQKITRPWPRCRRPSLATSSSHIQTKTNARIFSTQCSLLMRFRYEFYLNKLNQLHRRTGEKWNSEIGINVAKEQNRGYPSQIFFAPSNFLFFLKLKKPPYPTFTFNHRESVHGLLCQQTKKKLKIIFHL